jgi:hypothetical protein
VDKPVLAEIDTDVGKLQLPGVENEVTRRSSATGILPRREISCAVRGRVTPVTCWNT